LKAVLRVSENTVNGHVYHRLLVSKKTSRLLGFKKDDAVTLDIIIIKRDGRVVWPRQPAPTEPDSTADTSLERDIDGEKD